MRLKARSPSMAKRSRTEISAGVASLELPKKPRKARSVEVRPEHEDFDFDGELLGLERKAKILNEHPHLPVDYAHFRAQQDAFAERVRGYQEGEKRKAFESRFEQLRKNGDVVAQGEQNMESSGVLAESPEIEPAVDLAYRAKLDHLLEVLASVDRLMESGAEKEVLKKKLNGAQNALGAAKWKYSEDYGAPMTEALAAQADMVARKIDLYNDRINSPREVFMGENRETTTPEALSGREAKPKRKRAVKFEVPEMKEQKKAPRKTRKASRERILPGMVPEHLLQEGVLAPEKPNLGQIILPPEERLGKKAEGFGERLRHGFSYIWNRGEREAGEKVELKESETFGETAKTAAALARTAVTFGGVHLSPELVKHLPPSALSQKETVQLEQMLRSVAEGGTKNPDEEGYASYREGVRRLAERVSASRYGTPKEKGKVLGNIMRATIAPQEGRAAAERDQIRVSAELLTQPRERPLSHTEQALGEHLLRAPSFEAQSLAVRYKALSPEATDSTALERVRKFMTEQFSETAKMWNGESTRQKAYAGLKTLGKALGAAGFAYATRELWEVMPTMDTLTQDELHMRIDDALKASEARDDAHVLQELSAREAVLGGEEMLGEIGTVSIPSAEVEIAQYSDAELALGTVKPGDGITQALVRVIEHDPKRFGYDGADDELSIDLFARTLSRSMAKHDGLLRTWLTDESMGNLIVLPEKHADGWHVGFLDAKTHEEVSGNALAAFTKAQPRR
jgi:hypothetical protein